MIKSVNRLRLRKRQLTTRISSRAFMADVSENDRMSGLMAHGTQSEKKSILNWVRWYTPAAPWVRALTDAP